MKKVTWVVTAVVLLTVIIVIAFLSADRIYKNKKNEEYLAVKEQYEIYIRREKDWILSNCGENGEIYVNAVTPGGALEVNPYFACQACLGLLSAPCTEADIEAVHNYLVWHTDRIIECGAVISNYRYSKSRGELVATDSYDSADAYIALYLETLAEYEMVSGNIDAITDYASAIEICVDFLEQHLSYNLTVVKPGSSVVYLMDNVEVAYSLDRLEEVLGENERLGELKARIERGIEEYLWNETEQRYEVGIANSEGELFAYKGISSWYPDAIVQIYPVAFGMNSHSDSVKSNYDKICSSYSWEDEKVSNFEWPVIAYVAMELKDVSRVEAYIESINERYESVESRYYPYYVGTSAWIIRTETKYIEYYEKKRHTSLFYDYVKNGRS